MFVMWQNKCQCGFITIYSLLLEFIDWYTDKEINLKVLLSGLGPNEQFRIKYKYMLFYDF